MPNAEPDALLTLTTVSRRLAIGKRSVSRLVSEGRLPVVKLGPQTLRFRSADVDAFIGRSLQGLEAVNTDGE